MEDTRKEYVPPTAEIILLAPHEKLAANDFRFDSIWGRHENYFTNETGSGIAVAGTFGTDGENGWDGGEGFTFKQN